MIVEDEVLIADLIERYLSERGHQVVAKAISFEEGVEQYRISQPDLVLIDICLSGDKTGIDLAGHINRQQHQAPFIFLTSQVDRRHIELAKQTSPAGYLAKPVQRGSLYATIEIAVHTQGPAVPSLADIVLFESGTHHRLPPAQITYLEANHIYVHIYTSGGNRFVHRSSLTDLLDRLPAENFLQTHRSFAVNLQHIRAWDKQQLFLGDKAVPLSRSRRKEVLTRLERMAARG